MSRAPDTTFLTANVERAYNFVPLSRFVFRPPEAQDIVHDIPYADGLSGEVSIEITAETPILVGGKRDEQGVHFVEGPHGPFIPGSSLRGLISNVVEIASFGRLHRLDAARRFGVRDLTRSAEEFYQRRITKAQKNRDGVRSLKGGYISRVRTGILQFDPAAGWSIHECPYARIEQDVLVSTLGFPLKDLNPDRALGRAVAGTASRARPPSGEKARRVMATTLRGIARGLIEERGGQGLRCWIPPLSVAEHPRRKPDTSPDASLIDARISRDDDVAWSRTRIGASDWIEGRLVITGTIDKKKHREFIFLTSLADPPIRVPDDVIDAARTIHTKPPIKDQPSQWAAWKHLLDQGSLDEDGCEGGIPVFFLATEQGDVVSVESFGFAQLPKLAYPRTVGDMIGHRSGEHLDDGPLDLAEAIFGTVRDDAASFALKGRVTFSHAPLIGVDVPRVRFNCVLAEPKPSYFPFYVEQPVVRTGSEGASGLLQSMSHAEGQQNGGQAPYNTYLPTAAEPKPVIRGWKRYAPRTARYPGGSGGLPKDPGKVQSILNALPAQSRFRATMRFHNLRPFELGAVLFGLGIGDRIWQLEAPGVQHHALGMGKPYGFGTVRLALSAAQVRTNRIEPEGTDEPTVDEAALYLLDDAYDAYWDRMTEAFAASAARGPEGETWSTSDGIRALRALSRRAAMPEDPDACRVPYPRIEMDDEANDFAAIKGAIRGGKDRQTSPPRHALRAACPDVAPRPAPQPEPRERARIQEIAPPSWLRIGHRFTARPPGTS